LFAALAALIASAESWDWVAAFAQTRLDWLRKSAPFANGAPSADTLERVFAARLQGVLVRVGAWMAETCQGAGLKQVAVCGKAVWRAKKSVFSGCLSLVSAWAVENRLILRQEAVAEKSNEIAAIPKLLEVLDLKREGVYLYDAIPTSHRDLRFDIGDKSWHAPCRARSQSGAVLTAYMTSLKLCTALVPSVKA